jgi:multidrug efflux system membrane fusion protein
VTGVGSATGQLAKQGAVLASSFHRRSAFVLIPVLVALGLYLGWRYIYAGRETAALAPAAPGITITSTTAQKGDIGVYLDAIGSVTPQYTASITSQVTGQVVAVPFKEGQTVRKGDALIEINPAPYRATLLQAQGVLERDQNLLAQAQMDVERYRLLWVTRAVGKQILDDQEKLVLQDQGTVKNDQGTVDYDQIQVDFCHITAPIAGRMGLRLVDPGNVVQSTGTVTLAVVAQLQPITVIFTIPEDNIGPIQARLRLNATLAVDVFDRTAQTKIASGQLLTLDNQIDTTTGTIKARALFDNTNEALFPNQFVNARLLVNTLQGVTLVSASAIQQNGQASFVYLIQSNIAHLRSVTPGVTEAGMTQVVGINPGDIVADSSFDKLQDNVAVVIAVKPVAENSGSKQ